VLAPDQLAVSRGSLSRSAGIDSSSWPRSIHVLFAVLRCVRAASRHPTLPAGAYSRGGPVTFPFVFLFPLSSARSDARTCPVSFRETYTCALSCHGSACQICPCHLTHGNSVRIGRSVRANRDPERAPVVALPRLLSLSVSDHRRAAVPGKRESVQSSPVQSVAQARRPWALPSLSASSCTSQHTRIVSPSLEATALLTSPTWFAIRDARLLLK
jgi:hypothetical protein